MEAGSEVAARSEASVFWDFLRISQIRGNPAR